MAQEAGTKAAMLELAADGFTMVPGVFGAAEVDGLIASLTDALARSHSSVMERGGIPYAARNILDLWPESRTMWRRAPLPELLNEVLGPKFGLVRALFFDKPPEHTWSLPWHKDLTIAVRDNRTPSSHFVKPTTKEGVPHVEAPEAILQNMLTARIHLDDMTTSNGPIRVMPGSHHDGKRLLYDETKRRTITAKRGDVLLIRPLTAHSSLSTHGSLNHRRILHLEFAGTPHLPDDYAWQHYIKGQGGVTAEQQG
jgi:ectoine hydroxylase-related dioxygenase (phytanoyl-CoA dioxygenase family)